MEEIEKYQPRLRNFNLNLILTCHIYKVPKVLSVGDNYHKQYGGYEKSHTTSLNIRHFKTQKQITIV